ncbi:MAG: hypothetical protein KKD44_24525 [Proteobacteria bacterium]|nr:hypothetical protein [Pseudomonadota bacterium]
MIIKLPSYKAAILLGLISIPFFESIEKILPNEAISNIIDFIGFGVLLLISSADFNYIRQEMKNGRSFFGPWMRPQDFKECFIPSWKRMFVYFLSTCVSAVFFNFVKI